MLATMTLLLALGAPGMIAMASGYPESAHPYAASCDVSWNYTYSGTADYIKVTFSADTKTEENFDFIDITTNAGDTYSFSGTALAGKRCT